MKTTRNNWNETNLTSLPSKLRKIYFFIILQLNFLKATCKQSLILSHDCEVESFVSNEIIRKNKASTSHHHNCKRQDKEIIILILVEEKLTTQQISERGRF